MATAATLAILVEANTSSANANLRSVQSTLNRTSSSARTATTHTDRLSSASSKLGGMLKGAAASAGAAALAYVSIAQAKDAISTTEDLAKATISLHKNLGLSVKSASEWAAVAKTRGVDSTKLGMAFKTLATQVTAARDGSEASVAIFKKLGFSMEDIQKGSRDTTFLVKGVSDGLNNLAAGSDKAAISGKLFGRGWQTVAPILRDGSEALQEQLDLANKYGATFGGKTIKTVYDLIAAQRELQMAQLGLQITFTEKVAPALMKAGLALATFLNQMRKGKGAGADFRDALVGIAHTIGDTIDVIKRIAQIMHPFLAAGVEAFKMFADNIKRLVRVIGDVLNLRFAKAFSDLRDLFTNNVGHLIAIFGDLTAPVRHIVSKVGDVMVGGFRRAIHAVGKSFAGLVETLRNVGNAIGSVFRKVAQIVGAIVHFIIHAVNEAIDKLGDLKDKIPSPHLQPPVGIGHIGPVPVPVPQSPIGWQSGGLAATVPGTSTGDRHMLTLNGQPIAKVESGEGIFVGNRNMMAMAAKVNAQVPRYAGGGLVGMQPAAASLAKTFTSKFGGAISSGFRPGDPGFHGRGMAFDWVPGNATGATAFANQIGPQILEGIHNPAAWGRSVSWDSGHQVSPGFWGSATWAEHVDHLHMAVAQALGALGKLASPTIGKFKITGRGPLAGMTRTAAEKMRKAANRYIGQHSGTGLGASVPTGPIQQMAKAMVSQIWGAGQWSPFNALEMSEAGWNPRAVNPKSGAAGLAQALPPSKYPPGAWPYQGLSSAKLQLQWMMGYIKERYGSPASAWAFHQANNWYGNGGDFIARRPQLIGVGDRGPERVQVTPLSQGGGQPIIHIHIDPSSAAGMFEDRVQAVIEDDRHYNRTLQRMR